MGEARLSCMVRDPHCIHCSWELAGAGSPPRPLEAVRWVLRVAMGDEAPYDVEIDPAARSWYLRVDPGRRYRVELGRVTGGGEFLALASGGEVRTPPEPLGALGRGRAGGDRAPLSREFARLLAQGLVGSSANSYTSMSGPSPLCSCCEMRRPSRSMGSLPTLQTVSGHAVFAARYS